jgi:hypothetical protein
VVRSVASNNTSGVGTFNGGRLQLSASAVSGNTLHTWANQGSGGTLQSYGDNNVVGNADGDLAFPSSIDKK